MTSRKTTNSILFLTTLSVYLGLVLVGGSPSVFAQAALTPRFELVNEFEVEDDLDKKPDADPFTTAADAIIRRLSSKTVFDWNTDESYRIQGMTFFGKAWSDGGFEGILLNDRPFELQFGDFARVTYEKASADEPDSKHPCKVDFKIVNADPETAFTASFPNKTGNDAVPFGDTVARDLKRSEKAAAAARHRVTAKNTSVSRTENQIFIVTNLPRASIDDTNSKSD